MIPPESHLEPQNEMMTKSPNRPIPLTDCEYAEIEITSGDTLNYFKEIRTYVQHEDGLINTRLTWSLSIHGFLFATYGLVMGKLSDLAMKMSDQPDSFLLPMMGLVLLILQYLITDLGVSVGTLSAGAIEAAHKALNHIWTIAHASDALRLHQKAIHGRVRRQRIVAGRLRRGNQRLTAFLPKVVSGGAKDSVTRKAHDYYRQLPIHATNLWYSLRILSGTLLLITTFYCTCTASKLFIYHVAPLALHAAWP